MTRLGRPKKLGKRMTTTCITVDPDDWEAFLVLQDSRGVSASAAIRGLVRIVLKKARQSGEIE